MITSKSPRFPPKTNFSGGKYPFSMLPVNSLVIQELWGLVSFAERLTAAMSHDFKKRLVHAALCKYYGKSHCLKRDL
jgi:hypothetical protein